MLATLPMDVDLHAANRWQLWIHLLLGLIYPSTLVGFFSNLGIHNFSVLGSQKSEIEGCDASQLNLMYQVDMASTILRLRCD